jgi:hypothetical protein
MGHNLLVRRRMRLNVSFRLTNVGSELTWEQSSSAVGFTLPPIRVHLINFGNLVSLFERQFIILGSIIAVVSKHPSIQRTWIKTHSY